jgi:hypothetical protein
MVNVQAILGHITLFAGSFPNELYAGEVICIENGMPHRSQQSRIQFSLFYPLAARIPRRRTPKKGVCGKFRDHNVTHGAAVFQVAFLPACGLGKPHRHAMT